MAKGLAVGRHHQGGTFGQRERADGQPFGKPRAIIEPLAKRDRGGQLSIEAKYRNAVGAIAPSERTSRATIRAVSPEPSLLGCQNYESDPRASHRRERFVVRRTFRQPHPQRLAPKTIGEIRDAPSDLKLTIARAEQRQN